MDISRLEEKKISSRLIYDGQVVHLYVDEIELPDGKHATREYVRHTGAVCVVPLTEQGEVICVRQYRYPFGRVMLEIPAGKLDSKEEDPTSAALRELREETGAHCESLIFLGEYYPSVAILDENIRMFLATGLSFGSLDLDEDEFLQVERVPLSELVERIMSGEICDGKTQVAILKVWKLLQEQEEKI